MANDNELVLGRGKVFFAPYRLNETTDGIKGDFGNAPAFTLAQTSQALDHYSSRAGLKVLDKSVVLQQDMTATFTLDDINLGNMTFWFGGDLVGAEPADAPTDIGDLQFIGKAQSIYGALFFEADNPVGGNRNFWFPYVNLQPSGNFDMLGDTWQTMGFTAKVLKRDNTTERVYVYELSGGSSAAAADASPRFTPLTAGVSGGTVATGGTVVESDNTQVHLVEFPFTYTLTGGTVAYVYAHDGTSNTGTPVVISGASGTGNITINSAGTYTLKSYAASDGSGSALATSASITVS